MADLLQFLVKTPVQPRGKFIFEGALTDLDGPSGGTCTVTVTLPDGSAGPASGTVTHVSTGIYSFTLAGPADPTAYDIAWSGQIGGKAVTVDTQAEAVGEFLFNLADLRDLRVGDETPFEDPVKWPAERLQEARTATLDEFERMLGFSPVPRFHREVLDGEGTRRLQLSKRKVHRDGLLSVTVDGQDLPVDGYRLNGAGVLRPVADNPDGSFPVGVANVAVEYVHGWERVEGEGSNMAMLWAAMRLNPAISSQAASMTTPDGTSYDFDAAGQVTRAGHTRHSGVPKIDAWLNRWRMGPRARTLTYNPQAGSLFHGGRR
jgi:hypothetical protein